MLRVQLFPCILHEYSVSVSLLAAARRLQGFDLTDHTQMTIPDGKPTKLSAANSPDGGPAGTAGIK